LGAGADRRSRAGGRGAWSATTGLLVLAGGVGVRRGPAVVGYMGWTGGAVPGAWCLVGDDRSLFLGWSGRWRDPAAALGAWGGTGGAGPGGHDPGRRRPVVGPGRWRGRAAWSGRSFGRMAWTGRARQGRRPWCLVGDDRLLVLAGGVGLRRGPAAAWRQTKKRQTKKPEAVSPVTADVTGPGPEARLSWSAARPRGAYGGKSGRL